MQSNENTVNKRSTDVPQKKSPLREILEWVLCIGVALLISMLIHAFIGRMIVVDGNSMNGTLADGERLICSRITYLTGSPQRGDIAVVHYPQRKEYFIKRVVALAGDTVSVHDGALYVNGVRQKEDYIAEGDGSIRYSMEERVVEEGHVFVLGDNRNNSNDSHVQGIGAIPMEKVVGKAVWVVWPFSSWGSPYK